MPNQSRFTAGVFAAVAMMIAAPFASVNAQDVNKDEAIADRTSLTTELTPVTGDDTPSVDLYIHFGFDSAQLTERDARQLQELAAALNSSQLRRYAFGVYGHTDAVGEEDYNKILSTKRANAVAIYLATQGVLPSRLDVRGYGEEKLKYAYQPDHAENRRVEIILINGDKSQDVNDENSEISDVQIIN